MKKIVPIAALILSLSSSAFAQEYTKYGKGSAAGESCNASDLHDNPCKKPKVYTCKDLYAREIEKKLDLRIFGHSFGSNVSKGEAIAETVGGTALVAGSVAGEVALLSSSAAPAVMVGGTVLLGATGYVGAKLAQNGVRHLVGTREERALALQDEASKQYERFVKKVQKHVPSATEKEIEHLVEKGFYTGEFCRDYDLMTFREIKKNVIKKLKAD